MQATHAIDRPAPTNRQIGHVERSPTESFGFWRPRASKSSKRYTELLLRITAEVLLDERRSETIKARSHRCVGGEKISRSGDGQSDLKRSPGFFHESSGAFQHREGRMPFIQVADFRLDAERCEQSPSADPEYHLLFQAQLRPAPVKLTGNASMRGVIRCIIAVQQVELYATDLNLPDAQPDWVTG